MRSALRVVDSLVEGGYGRLAFRFGGGTVLMFAFDHRISIDIDLFLDDAQALSFLSPRLNDLASSLAAGYVEQANSVKLALATGDIDFIVAGSVTQGQVGGRLDFEGRSIALEPVAEILAKKLMYRASAFKPRDVFDISTALALDPAAALIALSSANVVHPLLLERLAALSRLDETELARDIAITPAGACHLDGMIERVVRAIERSERP